MDVGNVDKPLPSPLSPPSPGAIDSLSVPGDVLGSIADIPPSPASASFATDAKQKKANPLVDLIDTEKAYVDLLAGIIRKIAAAWSRSNLPPKDLDIMFRSIEGVYKANRSLYSKLKEVGTNPSNPKALGDLLMRWIDDLNIPYTTYSTKFRCGFDTWDPVQSNPKLANILSTFSATNPPPASATASHSTDPPTWTLDDLFLLPKARLKYYKKLYGRLLKSTAPGRSDYRLLVGALETLDTLMATLESRSNIFVGETDPVPPPSAVPGAGENAPLENEPTATAESIQSKAPGEVEAVREPLRREPSLPPPPPPAETRMVSQQPTPVDSRAPSPSRASTSTLSMPVTHLEQRLSTQRTLDIFTMQPKTVRLQIAPPSLTFTRELRYSGDVTISFTPKATGIEVVHVLGHIFLLSDLFLVCERVAPEEMSQVDAGVDMWLCYPPLSGKVLRVSDIPEKPNAFRVAIMRKEHLTIETSSIEVRNKVMTQFKECIDFAASLPPPSKQPPPPVPPLNVNAIAGMMPGNDRPPRGAPPPGSQTTGRHMSMSPPSTRSPSPRSQPSSIHHGSVEPSPMHGLPGLPFSPEAILQPGAHRTLSPQNTIMAGPPRATSTVPQVSNGMPPVRPGQGLPANPRDPRDPRGSLSPPPPGAGYPPGAGPNMGPPRILSPGPPRPGSGFSQQSHQGGPPNMMHGPPGQAPFPPNNYGQGGPPNMMHGPPPGQAPFPPNNHMMQQQHPFPTRPNQPGMPGPPGPHGGIGVPPRPPSEPGRLRSSISNRSLGSQYSEGHQGQAPPIPPFPGGHPPPNGQIFRGIPRSSSFGSLQAPRPVLPSENVARSSSMAIEPSFDDPSPPTSPVMETPKHIGPITSTISATMKCKVFLQQQHAQWKSLGTAKLKLYRQTPTNVKQLVVEADDKNHSVLISTIVLTDGVERVGKTGVAIELSDNGQRTGVVYMIQLRNEKSAGGLFDSLLEGSDRGTVL